MPTFGNTEVGDEFLHALNGDIWGSIFPAPENGYAKSITVYLKCGNKPSKVRCSLYTEFIEQMRKRFRFVMATEEKIIPANFEGRVTFNFTAPPPISKGTKYWINAWADEFSYINISTKKTLGIFQSAEWTSYMAGQPHGLSYPRFYEVVPQSARGALICSIHCTYDYDAPTICKCPYCGSHALSYSDVLEHIKKTPIEMVHLQICKCGRSQYLKEELQLHAYEAHQIGTPPDSYSCPFCSCAKPTAKEIYDHINTLA